MNPQPTAYESVALPIELPRQFVRILLWGVRFVNVLENFIRTMMGGECKNHGYLFLGLLLFLIKLLNILSLGFSVDKDRISRESSNNLLSNLADKKDQADVLLASHHIGLKDQGV